MKHIPLYIPFLLASSTALFAMAFFPAIPLFAFAPFLALVYMRQTFVFSLWIAALCGLMIDLLSSTQPFGLHAINYTLATILLYKQKRHFFDDKPLALSLFTILVSSVATFSQLFLMYAFSQRFPLSWKFALSDLIAMPFLDALYAFLWFTCPFKFYTHIKKVGWKKAFSLQKDEPT